MGGLRHSGPRSRSTARFRQSGPSGRTRIAQAAGCRTAKVKVAERGQCLTQDVGRLEAVRDALGADGKVRMDANGGLDR